MNATTRRIRFTPVFAALLFASACPSPAGPPFLTDDPEPVMHRHWEVYLASQSARDQGDWSGTAPQIEVNYGAVTNLQLHLIAPIAFSAPRDESTHYDLGDTEAGAKYRFLTETESRPQAGIFPLAELPTGNPDRGLGSGHIQLFLPVWLQKSSGPWTTYGGGGYWINPGDDNRNGWFTGWALQRQVLSSLALGAEVFHATAREAGGNASSGFDAGGIVDFSELHHLLFSAGHTFQGPSRFQCYVAYQLTFGPAE
jgi:hypothetical protein